MDREILTRGHWLRRSVGGSIALSAAGAAVATIASASAKAAPALTARDRQVVAFLLTLEQLEASFFAQARRAGKLTGEARQFAETVGGEESAHVRYLSGLLGRSSGGAQRYRFGDALASTSSFVDAAESLQETVLAAYNGQAENLTRHALGKVARVMSVESRHAAWARGLGGKLPAPVAADVPMDAAAAMKAIHPFLAS